MNTVQEDRHIVANHVFGLLIQRGWGAKQAVAHGQGKKHPPEKLGQHLGVELADGSSFDLTLEILRQIGMELLGNARQHPADCVPGLT